MGVSPSGFWADEAQCSAAGSLSGTWDVDTSWWVAGEASHAAKGHETDPRRLVSEVGPSETGHCVSGAGGPGCNKTITAPRRLAVAEGTDEACQWNCRPADTIMLSMARGQLNTLQRRSTRRVRHHPHRVAW
jgi:hypothetical protein